MTGPYVVRHLERPAATCRFGHAMDDGLSECPACGVGRPSGSIPLRVVSVKAFETLDGPGESSALLYARELLREHFDVEGLAGMPDDMGRSEQAAGELGAALERLYEVGPKGGKVSLPDGGEIEVEQTTWKALADAIVALDPAAHGRSIPDLPPSMWSGSGRAAAVRAFNSAMAEYYGTEGRA